MDEKYSWIQVGCNFVVHKPTEWSTAHNEKQWSFFTEATGDTNMRIAVDVPLVGINEDGKNVRSDSSVRFISKDCEVVTLKTPDGKKYRLDHDMLQKAVETIGRVNC